MASVSKTVISDEGTWFHYRKAEVCGPQTRAHVIDNPQGLGIKGTFNSIVCVGESVGGPPPPPSFPSEGRPSKTMLPQPSGSAMRPGQAATTSPPCRSPPSPAAALWLAVGGTRPPNALQPHPRSAHSTASNTFCRWKNRGSQPRLPPHVLLGLRRPSVDYADGDCLSIRTTTITALCGVTSISTPLDR